MLDSPPLTVEAPMANVRTEEVELTVDGKRMPAFLALPEAAGPRPAVLVFQEIFGVNAHIRDVTKRIAAEGYVALAPDYHHRAWEPGTQRDYNDENMKRGMELIPKLSADGILADVDACIAFLKTRKEANAAKLGAIGFCIGGHVTYLAAAPRPPCSTAAASPASRPAAGRRPSSAPPASKERSCACSARTIR